MHLYDNMLRRKSVMIRWKDAMGRLDGVECLGLLVVSGRMRIVSGKFKHV